MNLYLSISIDRNANAAKEYEETSKQLMDLAEKMGHALTIFRPGPAFSIHLPVVKEEQYILSVNEFALGEADACLIKYVPGRETWGCPQELFYCAICNMTCVILVPPDFPGPYPVALQGRGFPLLDDISVAYLSLFQSVHKFKETPK